MNSVWFPSDSSSETNHKAFSKNLLAVVPKITEEEKANKRETDAKHDQIDMDVSPYC